MADANGLNPGDEGYDASTDTSLPAAPADTGSVPMSDSPYASYTGSNTAGYTTGSDTNTGATTTLGGIGNTLSKIGSIITSPNSGLTQLANGVANTAAWNNVATGYSNAENTLSGTNAAIQSQYAPLIAAGTTGTQGLTQIAQNGTPASEVNSYLNPSVGFALGQGQAAIERSAAARGGNLSSGALQDISSYITGQANQNYNAAATLAQNSTQQKIAANQGLTTAGVNATNNASNIAETTAGNIAVDQANVGNAYAGGITGTWGALNGQGTSNVAPAPASSTSAAPASGGGGGSSGGGGALGQIGSAISTVGQIAGTISSIASLF